jgi:outer membrane protein TolC
MKKRWNIIIVLTLILAGFQVKSQNADTLKFAEALALALENNYDISLAYDDVKIAGINNSAGNAGMLPKIDLSAAKSLAINNSHQEYFDGRTRGGKGVKNRNQSAGIALTWTFFDGLNMFIQKEKLNEMEQLSNFQLRSVIENTVSQVANAYYNIVVQKRMADVYAEALSLSAERQYLAKVKFDLGGGSELAYLQATVDRNADSANYVRQMAVVENSVSVLNQLLCRDLKTEFEVEENIPMNFDLLYDELWNKVQEQNPQLLEARGSEKLAELAIKEVKATQYPRLSFNSGYNYSKSASDVGIYILNRNLGFTVGVSMSYNIFNGFTNKQKIKVARIRQESVEKENERLKLDIEASLQQVYNDYQTNLKLVEFEKESKQFAAHNFEVANEKYRLGTFTDIELRETQQKLMDAETRLLSAMFRCKSAELELLRISGQLSADIN